MDYSLDLLHAAIFHEQPMLTSRALSASKLVSTEDGSNRLSLFMDLLIDEQTGIPNSARWPPSFETRECFKRAKLAHTISTTSEQSRLTKLLKASQHNTRQLSANLDHQQRQHLKQCIYSALLVLYTSLEPNMRNGHSENVQHAKDLYAAVGCVEDSTRQPFPYLWLWM